MLMPGLSVTLIGLAIAAIAIALRKPVVPALLWGLLGAWVGFAALGLVGMVVDVVLFNGVYVAILGHIGAVIGAAIAVARAGARRYT